MLALSAINQLLPFKLTVDEFFDWARDIDRLVPGVEAAAISFLVDKFMLEEIIYDKSKGIQNIFRGLTMIEKTESGYEIKPTTKYTW